MNVPGGINTSVYAINDSGEVAGTYSDSSGEHGFLAIPEGGEATASEFGELLSAHARLGGMRDFLPGVPSSNGSSHSAHASGMTDRTSAAGAGFASFGGVASDHTATQALVHGHITALGPG